MSLYDRVKRAADEHIPKGEVLAWSHVDGTNITWEELVKALEPVKKAKIKQADNQSEAELSVGLVQDKVPEPEEDKLDVSKEQR